MEIFMAIESGLRRKSASEPGVGKECFGVGELGRLGGLGSVSIPFLSLRADH